MTPKENAIYPPRGWNSYDSFSWTIVEREFLDNAAALSSLLLDHGYEVHFLLVLEIILMIFL